MCLNIFDWFNNEILVLFSDEKTKKEKSKIEPLVKIIIDEIREEPKLESINNLEENSWDIL